MRFDWPIPFEIPDSVWSRSGAQTWQSVGVAFAASPYRSPKSETPHPEFPIEIVPIAAVTAPVRDAGTPLFVDHRLLDVLQAIVRGETLPAMLGQRCADHAENPVEVIDGMHRFYASAAVGFTHVPVAIRRFIS